MQQHLKVESLQNYYRTWWQQQHPGPSASSKQIQFMTTQQKGIPVQDNPHGRAVFPPVNVWSVLAGPPHPGGLAVVRDALANPHMVESVHPDM